ncbi:MAG: tetratricopeptide repeat protein [Ignavibacteriales bacterium]|nr:tetratricopeptide repeat protein [Ignavibacteriales bacterium]
MKIPLVRIARIAAVCLVAVVVVPAQQSRLEEGVLRLWSGNDAEAKKIFDEILKSDDKNAEAHYRLAQVYLRRALQDEDEAVDHMERAVELNPNNADYQFTLGQAYGLKAQKAGIIKKMIVAPKVKTAFEKAVQLNPRHVGAHIGLTQYLWQAPGIIGGDMERAWKEVEIVRSLDEFQGARLKVQILEREKKFDDAEKEYRSYTTAHPKDWRVWKNYGYFCLRRAKNDEAVTAFDKYVELKPDTADAYDSRAEALIKKNEYDKAETDLTKALSLDNNFISAVEQLAQVYEHQGKKKEARETYQRYASLERDETKRKKAEEKVKSLQ